MPTKEELKIEIAGLAEKVSSLQEENLDLQDRLDNAGVKASLKKEKTQKLYWLNDVDLSQGLEPSAFGLRLFKDEDGNYFSDVPVSRVESELGRKGKAFVETLELVEEPENTEEGDDE